MPERWLTSEEDGARDAGLRRSAYFPFGAGVRSCIGESFAWMELVLALSTIAQRWKLEAVPGHPVEPQPVITLRLKHGLKMTVRKRA